jgi:hypothetical protein
VGYLPGFVRAIDFTLRGVIKAAPLMPVFTQFMGVPLKKQA